MSLSTNIGHLKQLHLRDIEPLQPVEVPRFVIMAVANLLTQGEAARNWVPLIVREVGEEKYELLGNTFVYAVAEAAGLEKVWCIVADNSPETAALAQALAQEVVPKIDLRTASRNHIKAALEYLKAQPKTTLKSLNIATATDCISEADRSTWKTLTPIAQLKCGITKAKLKDLEKVFYLSPLSSPTKPDPTPDPEPVITPLPETLDKTVVSQKTVAELKEIASARNLSFNSKVKKADLVALIVQNQ